MGPASFQDVVVEYPCGSFDEVETVVGRVLRLLLSWEVASVSGDGVASR